MLEKLQAKRAVLVAQRDQLNANMNATLGAIAIIDELIGEELETASKALSESPKSESVVNIDASGVDPAAIERLNEAIAQAGSSAELVPE